jgi:tRNA pseudouridine55 synthase
MEDNVLYVNKPAGISSFDVCYRLRKVLHTKKIGHTGTLDPNATGVMIVLFDKATKANQFLVSDRKKYETRVLLGIKTDTLDTDGKTIEMKDYTLPEENTLRSVLLTFMGRSMQEVPITSAVSVNGKRLYEYQRDEEEVELPVREIEVFSIGLEKMHGDGFTFIAEVSSGTYIRALVRDILDKLETIGTVCELKRLSVDDICLEDCDDLFEIEKGNFRKHNLFDLLKKRYPVIDYAEIKDIYNGKKIRLDCEFEKVLIVHGNEALAIYERDGDIYRCVRGLW